MLEFIIMFLKDIFLNELGEGELGDAGTDSGQGEAPPVDTGEGIPPEEGTLLPSDTGQGEIPPVNPKYGDFGDTPQTLEEAMSLINNIYDAHGNLKEKTTATERNLAMTRNSLEKMGIKPVQDEQGNITFEVVGGTEGKQEQKSRFNDDAIKKLSVHFQNDSEAAKSFVDILRLAMQDETEAWYTGREKTSSEKNKQMQTFVKEKTAIENRMVKRYPSLNPKYDDSGKPTNPEFNKSFYDLATKIWIDRYGKNPLKQLYAAMDAEEELGLHKLPINQAKKEGYRFGKESKKIIAPAGSGGKQQSAGLQVLSKEDYLKLSLDDRNKYDKWRLDNPDA